MISRNVITLGSVFPVNPYLSGKFNRKFPPIFLQKKTQRLFSLFLFMNDRKGSRNSDDGVESGPKYVMHCVTQVVPRSFPDLFFQWRIVALGSLVRFLSVFPKTSDLTCRKPLRFHLGCRKETERNQRHYNVEFWDFRESSILPFLAMGNSH